MKKYDIAAYIWPAYTGKEPKTRIFWPEGNGEWETVRAAKTLYPEHKWPRVPLWGYTEEADPYVMEAQINAAADHGVNVFIYDWYWFDQQPFLEQCLNEGYLKARNNDRVKFFLMWANHTADSLWDRRTAHLHSPIWDGAVDRRNFEIIVDRTIEKYFSQPSYYKIDGKPVYMLFHIPNFIRGLGGVEEALDALQYFRNKTKEAGFPDLELLTNLQNDAFRDQKLNDDYDIRRFMNEAFDGCTHYNFYDYAKMNRSYPEILEDVKAEWKKIEKQMDLHFYPHVSLGWDNSLRFEGPHRKWICYDNTPENVQKGFELAKEYIDSHELPAPLVVVNSWNEWTEGSYLQPDDLNGYGYLEAVKKVFMNDK